MGALALLAVALLASPAFAHAPDAPAQAMRDVATTWPLEPWAFGLLAVSAWLYAKGLFRLWGHAGKGRGISPREAAAFAGGWFALVVALATPLDSLGGRLFSAHMLQHEILMLVAAPLLVLGRPLAAWTWAFSPVQRHLIGHGVKTSAWSAFWATVTDPLAAWALHAIALWAWHLPALFEAALHSEALHALQHASFLFSALLFWWAVIGGDPRSRRGGGAAMLYLFTTMLHTGALGALLTLAPTPWYPTYAASTAALGIDPVDDQQLGGLLMWVPGGLAYLVAGLVVAARLLNGPKRLRASAARPRPLR